MEIITVSQCVILTGLTRSHINNQCIKGKVPEVIRCGRQWLIPVKSITTFNSKKSYNIKDVYDIAIDINGLISADDYSKKYKIKRDTINRACVDGRCIGALKIGKKWMLRPEADILKKHHKETRKRNRKTDKMLDADEWASDIGITTQMARIYLRESRVPGAYRTKTDWRIYPGTPKPKRTNK